MFDSENKLQVGVTFALADGRFPGPISQVDAALHQLLQLVMESTDSTRTLPPQDRLAELFRVSRTAMREAISQLIAHGMIDATPKRGTQVTDSRDWRVVDGDVVRWRSVCASSRDSFYRDLAAVVALVLPDAAADLAMQATAVQVDALSIACSRRATAKTLGARNAARAALYRLVFTSSTNSLFGQMVCFADVLWANHRSLDDEQITFSPDEVALLDALEKAWSRQQPDVARTSIATLVTRDLQELGVGDE